MRAIIGTNVSVQPFPLMTYRNGLNTSCAFRTSFEFQPVSGANVAIVGGNNQTVAANQPAPSQLAVNVTDNTGKPLAGRLVSFAVVGGSANIAAPARVLTDSTGTASAGLTMGAASGPVGVTAKALGVAATFSLTNPGPAINQGGVVGIGGSVPAVTTITPGSLFSIYGQDFVPASTGRRVNTGEIINGMLPTNLLGVCVTVGGLSAPLLDVFPGQIDAVAPDAVPGAQSPNVPIGSTEVTVTTGCGTTSAGQSLPQIVPVTPASPEFFYFQLNANGQNPVAAINAITGAYLGPSGLGSAFGPAWPGDLVSVFGSGFAPTNPVIPPGAFASGQAPVAGTVVVTLGGVTLDPSDVLYAGAAPGEIISQLNIRIPAGTPAGNLTLQISIGGITSPGGAYLAIAAP